MKSVDVNTIFVHIYGLCRNWVMNKKYTIHTLVSNITVWDHVVSVQLAIDLYRGDCFVAAKTPYSQNVYLFLYWLCLDFNLSISVSSYFSRTALSLETAIFHLVCKKLFLSSANFQSQNDLQTERRVSSNFKWHVAVCRDSAIREN